MDKGVGGAVRDGRLVQTAVVGDRDADEPVLLPTEAAEVEAFLQHHTGGRFWCGLLLGGCGGELTTKTYLDRVCHFAHLPDPSGHERVCTRRARDESSADHLFLKSAAATWLAERGERARFDFPRPDGIPFGSVVDIVWEHTGGCLRVHLDQAVLPDWDTDAEPVLGTSVPVDDETLVRRWYVHRIGLETRGSRRHVRLGTEAFARPTEWFDLDQCRMTPDGLRTPATERIVQARRTPPPQRTAAPRTLEHAATEPPRTPQQEMAARLTRAVHAEAATEVAALCHQIAEQQLADQGDGSELAAAYREANAWMEDRDRQRTKLFDQLRQAVADHKTHRVGELLAKTDAVAGRDRSREEDAVTREASLYLEEIKRSALWEARDSAPPAARGPKRYRRQQKTYRTPQAPSREEHAHRRLRDLLGDLDRLAHTVSAAEVRRMVDLLNHQADIANCLLTHQERLDVSAWNTTAHNLATNAARAAEERQAHLAARRERRAAARTQPAATTAGRREKTAGRKTVKKPDKPQRPRLSHAELQQVAAAVRGALKKTARERGTISWSRLRRQLGNALPRLHPDDRIEVLTQVEENTRADEPLLSSLLAVNDTGRRGMYERLATRLHKPTPVGEGDTGWQSEVLRLHHIYRYR